MPFLSGYSRRKAITIDHTNVDSDLTDFPLLVKVTSDADIGANIDAGGLNIRFTSSDGETLLKYERQSFSVSGGAATGQFWVKVPTVAGASDTTIYIYYKGGATSDGEDAENVWDSNFVAVWHLDESSGTILDSTANNNDSTATLGTPDYGQAGKVDSAINFQPSECFDIGMATFAASAGTISGWVRTDLASPANNFYWLGRNRSGNFAGDINCFQSSGDLWRFDLQDGTNTRACQSNSAITDGQWYHFVGRWNASETALFIDGVKQTDTDLGIDLPQHASRSLAIGHSSTTHSTADGFAWDGQIDEIRISSTDRSDAWIKFEHANINEADNELSFGDEDHSQINTVGDLVSCNQKTSSATLSCTTLITAEEGDLIVVMAASDNEDTTDGETSLHQSLTVGGHSATKLGEYTNAQGSANAGATVSIWYLIAPAQITSGATSLVTLSTGKTATVQTAHVFRLSDGYSVRLDGKSTLAADAAQPGSLSATGPEGSSDAWLWLRAIAAEESHTTLGDLTPTAGWTAFPGNGTTGNPAASNMSLRGEWKVTERYSSGASNPTLSATSDNASLLVGLGIIHSNADFVLTQAGDFVLLQNGSDKLLLQAGQGAAVAAPPSMMLLGVGA